MRDLHRKPKVSFLVLPSWPTLQGLNSGRGSDPLPASAPVASGCGWRGGGCFPFSGCPSLVLWGPLLPVEQQQKGEVFCRHRGGRRALLHALFASSSQEPGPGGGGGAGRPPTGKASTVPSFAVRLGGRSPPPGQLAPHPRTSLETAEGRAGRLAAWQLELASQPTPPTNTHAHTEEPSVKAGCRQASQAPSFLQARPSTLITGFCEMRQEWGAAGDGAGKVVIRSLSCTSMTGSPVHLALSLEAGEGK